MKLFHYICLAGGLAASLPSARAQTAPDTLPATDETKPTGATIELSPFEVRSSTDRGYVAGNAVSATRISTVINDLPFSINAITPQFISDTGAENLMDIVSQSAGVKSGVSATTQGNAVFSVRGFVQAPQRNGFSSNQLVSNYVDGSVIERVEVVKGPASLLYGAIAPGGTVNYITKAPEPKPFTEVRFSLGAYNAYDTTLDVNQPLATDKLLFRFVTSYGNGEQYYQNTHSHSVVVYPTLKWIITPNLSLKLDYQGYQQRQDPPAVYLPNSVIATPASIVKTLYGVGHPGSKSLLANQTGPAVAEGVSDSSDPGFMRPFPGLPKNFNYADVSDVKSDNLKTFNAELDAKLNDHWNGRIHVGEDIDHSSYNQTGHAAAYVAPPDSLVYANGLWSVAPSWSALTSDQQIMQGLAYAQQAVNNPGLLQSTQNGTPSPIMMDRAPRVQTQSVRGTTIQAEAVGSYDLRGMKLQVLAGVFYDHVTYSAATLQNEHTAASPFFRAWDVNSASPTYYVNTNEGAFTAQQMTSVDTDTTAINSDKAAYVLVNASCFDNRLYFVGGARYNVSSNQVTDNAAGSVAPALNSKYTTPQLGFGFKITRDVLLYASYSESYTLSTQPYLTVAGVVNGIPTAIPTGPTAPTIGRGYETGLKGAFLNNKLNLTLSVYQIEEDKVLQDLNLNIDGFSIDNWNQGAKQRARGIEASVSWELQKNWQIVFSAAEEDVRNIKEPFGLEYYLGQNVGYTAKPAVHFWNRYALPQPALKGLWIGAGVDYQGRSAGDPRNRDYYIPAYTLLNAAIGYDWKVNKAKLTTTLNIKNIRDVAYKDTPQSIGEPRRIQLACTLHY
ncbi:TonB-dependent receptor [Opitutus sp. GAS368]|uniref:TonB-dependent siderophore receptor n=1 Tax=Opitutus sp. GAS368 TaxID=1882749 RepID=UPI00087B2B7E|nr:TonB-dependent receptor [Opitutus sp. GAS368]SDR68214.1 TonB-dependent Receptor Plug Domain [Opitutus sp. GAS368]